MRDNASEIPVHPRCLARARAELLSAPPPLGNPRAAPCDANMNPFPPLVATPIAVIRSPYRERFGVPRQAGLARATAATVVCNPQLVSPEALRGLDMCSHVWLLAVFHHNGEAKTPSTVRPPRLGGNTRLGCLATRSPYRPNPIGLSAVALDRVDRTRLELHVHGADLVDGTPIVDIKPYLPYADIIADAHCTWAAAAPDPVPVQFSAEVEQVLSTTVGGRELRVWAQDSLRWDPRPGHRRTDPDGDARIYGVRLGDFDVRFRRRVDAIEVVEVVGRPAPEPGSEDSDSPRTIEDS
ncbi:MAG: tRNA (N6-threonylcarbamoyladenosine(37)-N6)-methyltransferase TrmO [Myxococcales bacterium FL481]|nr:MAG: tRNA (N6-threonylcarbamoyladenosine(37)-N6)-methyltransferase TrmO [Myxococcales bacterium FL481]